MFKIRNPDNLRELFGWKEYDRPLHAHFGLWQSKGGRLLARFWTRRQYVDAWYLEIVGFVPPATSDPFDTAKVPRILRSSYDEWLDYCLRCPRG